jgi:hypothetical protein
MKNTPAPSDELLSDLRQTPGLSRVVWMKGRLFIEGAIPAPELRSGPVLRSISGALNRMRKANGLRKFPCAIERLDWSAVRERALHFRLYLTLPVSDAPAEAPSRSPMTG